MKPQERALRGYNPDFQRAWREALKFPIRRPRSGYEQVQRMLTRLEMPGVFMRENSNTTELVIKFECSSRELPSVLRKMYFGNGVKLPIVFEQVLTRTASKGRSSFGSELATVAYNAYWQTWARLFEILYQDRFHPAVNPPLWLTEFKNNLKRKQGRRKHVDAGTSRKRFRFFLSHCKELRRSIEVLMLQKRSHNLTPGAIRMHIGESLWRQILEIPWGHSILGGEAFAEIPSTSRKKCPMISNLDSWTPRQLATALLAFESDLQYHTVEKKVANHGHRKSNRPQ